MAVVRASVRIASPDLGGVGANVWHLRTVSSGGSDAEIGGLMLGVKDFYTTLGIYMPTDVTVSWDGSAVQVGSAEPTLFADSDSWSVSGTSSTEALPPANCVCLTWRTSLGRPIGPWSDVRGPRDQ